MMPSSMTRLVRGDLEDHRGGEVGALAEQRPGQRDRRVGARRGRDPSPVAIARVLGRSSPSIRVIVSRRTTAWTTADRVKPRINAQRISQVIDPAVARAAPAALITLLTHGMVYPRGVQGRARRGAAASDCLLAFALSSGASVGCPAGKAPDRRQLQLGELAPSSSKRSEVRLPC